MTAVALAVASLGTACSPSADTTGTPPSSTAPPPSVSSTTQQPDQPPIDLASIDLRSLGVVVEPAGFAAFADLTDGGPILLESADGTSWQAVTSDFIGLPADIEGPYRLREFGSGYLLDASTSRPGESILSGRRFMATSDDLISWTDVTTGEDLLALFDTTAPYRFGNILGIGDRFAVGYASPRAANAPMSLLFRLFPDGFVELLPDSEFLSDIILIDDVIHGLRRPFADQTVLRTWTGELWETHRLPTDAERQNPTLRRIGSDLVVYVVGQAWRSGDGGSTWTPTTPITNETETFGVFSPNGAASPAQPPFGVPDFFEISTDGDEWLSVDLPPGAVDVTHLAVSGRGVLSRFKLAGDQPDLLGFTPFAPA